MGVSTHSPACSSQDQPASQDIACRLALFLEAQPSPQANELVAVMIKTNKLAVTVFMSNLLLPNKGRNKNMKSRIFTKRFILGDTRRNKETLEAAMQML
nr:hypothetical protein [uncultured bacterium]